MACTARKFHRPRPLTTERHHVVPQAWQAAVNPNSLFEVKVVEVCPTCHRNIHYWLVKLMHAVADLHTNDPLDAKKFVFGDKRLTTEQDIAYKALTTWTDGGRELIWLTNRGLWGIA
jgi:hypothetical protein